MPAMLTRIDRRHALGLLAGSALAGAETLTRPLGAQLYTVRRELQQQPEKVLREVAAIGYEEVEVQDAAYPALRPILDDLNLRIRGYRLNPAIVTGSWQAWAEVMKRFGAAGPAPIEQSVEAAVAPAAEGDMRNVVVSALLPHERDSLDAVKRTAEKFNRAGAACKRVGLTLCFHNHSYEFAEVEGVRLFDALNDAFDPDLVQWQIDVFWAAIGGQDPARLILENRGRVASLHLKDMAPDAPRTTEMKPLPPEAFRPVGAGAVDFQAVLRAATVTNIPHLFVEQDETHGPPLVALHESYRNLRKLEW